MNMKNKNIVNKSGGLLGAGVISAIAASLCCITPVLALISGASGVASTFSWLEPARPYLIGITVLVLGFAWYQKFKPRTKVEIECACEDDEKPNFWQSKKFLGIVTVFAALMLAFPYYSDIFYQDSQKEIISIDTSKLITLDLKVKGMTCESCNLHVEHAAQEVEGVYESKADFKTGQASVIFDPSKTSAESIVESINSTGYKVTESQRK